MLMNNDDDNETMSKIDRKYAQTVVLQRPTTRIELRTIMLHTVHIEFHLIYAKNSFSLIQKKFLVFFSWKLSALIVSKSMNKMHNEWKD